MTPEPGKARGRRHFLGTATLALAASRLGLGLASDGNAGPSRQLRALSRASGWLNSSPLSADALAGRVVAVQFGTYTCINWLRTLPYLRAWAHKYIGDVTFIVVHTPEFVFEKDLEKVRKLLPQMPPSLPVAVDNGYAIWRAFDNHYWPALYLLDGRGRVQHHQFGEGGYDRAETALQRLLSDARVADGRGLVTVAGAGVELPAAWQTLRSPEMYLGHDRARQFAARGGAAVGRPRGYAAPTRLDLNRWALSGEWTVTRDAAVLSPPDGRIVCRFHARDVHLVMGPSRPEHPVHIRVTIDGAPPGPSHGVDVDDRRGGAVVDHRMYQLVRQVGAIEDRTVTVDFLDGGVEAFAFTFG